MKRYKGIIFDLDGTLLNTIEDISDSMNEVLAIYGCAEHDYSSYKLKVGSGFRNLIEESFPKGTDIKIVDEGIKLFIDTYDKKYQNKTQPYKGIDNMLDELNKKGFKMGINSNKRIDYTKQLVSRFFSRIPFIEIFGERQGVPKKPDPIAAMEIAKLMGLSSQEILYVGDSKTDIMTAKNAGMDSIGVLWGFRSYEEFKTHGATYIVSDTEDILDIASSNIFS